MATKTETKVSELKINYLTEALYQQAVTNDEINENELYMTPYTARTIDGVSFDGSANITHYGTCSTSANTSAKTVSLTGFKLTTGAKICVKFSNTNSASNPTLNVNNTGAKNIRYNGANITASYLAANKVYEFVYDGTYWNLVGDVDTGGSSTDTKNTAGSTNTSSKIFLIGATSQAANPQTYSHDTAYVGTDGCLYSNSTKVLTTSDVSVTQSQTSGTEIGSITVNGTATKLYAPTSSGSSSSGGSADTLTTARTIDGVSFDGSANITHYGTCSTAAGTKAKTVSLTGFTLATGARICVKFSNTNTASSPTLNVNSTGAKTIRYNGAAITASYLAANKVYDFVYDGTYWNLVGDVDTTGSSSSGDYLPLSGGNMTGDITFNNAIAINGKGLDGNTYEMIRMGGSSTEPILVIGDGFYTGSKGYTNVTGYNSVRLAIPNYMLQFLKASTGQSFDAYVQPSVTNKINLGSTTYSFYSVCATNGVVQSSDRRLKENIVSLDAVDETSALFDGLKPVQYNFIEDSDRIHYGLIAQDIVETMSELGIAESELDLVHHDYHTDEETGEEKDTYALNYNNLIALLINEVQKLKNRVNELEKKALQ